MSTAVNTSSPVRIDVVDAPGQPEETPELHALYDAFEKHLLIPLWTEIGDLMPPAPRSRAVPHLWSCDALSTLAARSGDVVPVGRGGERRAIALANPGLGGRPFATPTLWAAIQYLLPGEDAPEHRHSQNAFRFVVEGEGVWTVVEGQPVPMRRGDFLPQPGWHWHAHHNATSRPMAWIDGLDIPLQCALESQFFEFGRDVLTDGELTTPDRSRSEQVWGHPGLQPSVGAEAHRGTPLLRYAWEETDAALASLLAADPSSQHASVRFVDVTSGRDALPTIRTEMSRTLPGFDTEPVREVGSSVYQVFDGSGRVTVGDHTWTVTRGDLFVVPSWQPFSVRSEAGTTDSDNGSLDLFRFSDTPVFEALGLARRSPAGNA
ncbi:MAG: cupin domain-containing protein [Nocardioides sp.]